MGGLEEDGVRFNGPHNEEGRRPADVYIPRWRRGVPVCLDFAVTSGLRVDRLRASAIDPASSISHYEGWKCDYLGTAASCRAEGMLFTPMVMEACGGGWGEEAMKTWSELAKNSALASGELRSFALSRLLGSMSIILHRENAIAILQRSPRSPLAGNLSSAAATLAGAAAEEVFEAP